MVSRVELSDFLSGAEKRAYKQALYAVRDPDHALDIVQDAMIKLAESYGDRPAAELPLLFTRIVQNTIHDFFRRQKVRNTWITLFSALGGSDDEDTDPIDLLDQRADDAHAPSAADEVERARIVQAIEQELQRLPARQREAFLLRYWEDMDVAETASTMQCSEGSVKTHCSRATQALARALRDRGISL